jgi:putative transposase
MFEIPAQVFRNGAYRYRKAVIAAANGAGSPTVKHRNGKQSVMLTSELFTVEDKRLRIASIKQDLGVIEWVAHRDFAPPRMIIVTAEPDGRWFVGFACEDGKEPVKAVMPENENQVLGVDLGIVQTVTTSEGRVLHPTAEASKRYNKRGRRIVSLQRRFARQKRGSHRQAKTKQRIARLHARQNNARRDFAHKTSLALCQSHHRAIAFEDIRLKNMTAAPAARPNESGGYDRNGASAKAGLNAALLRWSLGTIRLFTAYKAERAGKHFVVVPAAYSSQECSCCHHTSSFNRPSQAEFICQACGTTLNADHNGAIITAQRGYSSLMSIGNRQTMPVEQPPVAVKREAACVSWR